MRKSESIARRIMGWKLNRWDRWYDYEKREFIQTSDFQPENNLDHAMLIVKRMEGFGFHFQTNGKNEASFNNIKEISDTLPKAITNAAYAIIESHTIPDNSRIWQKLC
ncbi:hypothetical protein RZN22_16910 [Bacillaceae bacterium S4-13-58]